MGTAPRRETFQAQIGQDAHYLAAVANCYTLAQAKATLEGPTAFAAIRELLADCHEELSLHAFYAEVLTPAVSSRGSTMPALRCTFLNVDAAHSCCHTHWAAAGTRSDNRPAPVTLRSPFCSRVAFVSCDIM